MKAVVGAFNQEKALVGVFSWLLKFTDESVCSTTCEWTRGRTMSGRRYWIHSTTRVKVFLIQLGQVSTHCTLE